MYLSINRIKCLMREIKNNSWSPKNFSKSKLNDNHLKICKFENKNYKKL